VGTDGTQVDQKSKSKDQEHKPKIKKGREGKLLACGGHLQPSARRASLSFGLHLSSLVFDL
jgi:hypothetical protein